MGNNFYRGKDADIVAGSANFASLISAAASSYGLTSAQASAFAALNAALQSAYTDAVNPPTRTPVAVQAKDLAIKTMRSSAVNLSKIIYATPSVTDAQLVELGLLPRPKRTPVKPPTTAPQIDVVSLTGNTVAIRLHQAHDSSSRGKPAGVDGACVYSFVGAIPPSEEAEWTFQGVTSKTKLNVIFPSTVAPGAQVWFTAFWFNERKQNGPAAARVTTHIAGGSAMTA